MRFGLHRLRLADVFGVALAVAACWLPDATFATTCDWDTDVEFPLRKNHLPVDGVCCPGYRFEAISRTGPHGTEELSCLTCGQGTFTDRATRGRTGVRCQKCPQGTSTGGLWGHATAACYRCPIGTYSEDFGDARLCRPCPTGRISIGSRVECAPCAAGRFSTMGMEAIVCTSCPAGKYQESNAEPRGDSSCKNCPAGRFNVGTGSVGLGACALCPAGKFSTRIAAVDVEVCQTCVPGRYTNNDGSTECTTCPGGTYCTSPGSLAALPCLTPAEFCDGTRKYDVEPGFFGTGGTGGTRQTGQQRCDVGHFCVRGIRQPCPSGRYGNTTGLATAACAGRCAAGYFCGPASPRDKAFECSGPGAYCPEGSSAPLTASEGFYVVGGEGDSRHTAQLPCPKGSWCVGGVKSQCDAGFFGNSVRQVTPSCSGPCPAGAYCPRGAVDPVHCPAGYECPAQSGEPVEVAGGRYAVRCVFDPDAGAYLRCEASEECEPGHYCSGGAKAPCPAGRFGAQSGGASAQCDGACAAGFFCPEGSVVAQAVACGAPDRFCPEGAGAPTDIADGFVGVGADEFHLVDEAACPAGSYCAAGVQTLCPAGRYGGTTGLASPECSGTCAAGYVCGEGSTAVDAVPCLSATHYCPAGSGAGVPVRSGYYSVPEGDDVPKENELPCGVDEAGFGPYYCTQGVRRDVPDGSVPVTEGVDGTATGVQLSPAGFFAVGGVATPCTEPAFCPAGSVVDATACTDVRYVCDETGELSRTVIEDGYYKVVASATSVSPCGDPAFYCAGGVRQRVPDGYESVGGEDDSTRSATRVCDDPTQFCVGGVAHDVSPGFVAGAVPHAEELLCGNSSVWCTEGVRRTVADGHYSVNATVLAGVHAVPWGDTDGNAPTQAGHRTCDTGAYCQGGMRLLCPTGTYNNLTGASSADACTKCPAGTYQPLRGTASFDDCLPCANGESSAAGATQCWPRVTTVLAKSTGTDPGLDPGDTVELSISSPAVRSRLDSSSALQTAVQFLSRRCSAARCTLEPVTLGSALSGTWNSDGTVLTVSVLAVAAADPFITRIGALYVATVPYGVLCGADASALEQCQPVDYQDYSDGVAVDGTWGAMPAPTLVGITALDTGGQRGLGEGDSMRLDFDMPVHSPVQVTQQQGVDECLQVSASIGETYIAAWSSDFTQLTVTVTRVPQQWDGERTGVRVGSLQVNVRPECELRSRDTSSVAAMGMTATVNEGSWGDSPASVTMEVFSADSVVLAAHRPSTNPVLSFYRFQFEWSVDPEFGEGATHSREAFAAGQNDAVSILVSGLETGVIVYARARVMNPLGYGEHTVAENTDAQPQQTINGGLAPGMPILSSIRGGEAMSTAGGEVVEIFGAYLGMLDSPVSAYYFQEATGFNVTAKRCIVRQSGRRVQCTTGEGAGVGFRWVVVVGGYESMPSEQATTAYAAPTVLNVLIDGLRREAQTPGGEVVELTGSGFGPVELQAIDSVTYSPLNMPGMVMNASDCVVAVAHVLIRCSTASGGGDSLEWTVVVAGQPSVTPRLSYELPIIDEVFLLDDHGSAAALARMSTAGGDRVRIRGRFFGPNTAAVKLSVRYSNGNANVAALTATMCNVTVANSEIICRTVAGAGTDYRWRVTVFGQQSGFSSDSLSYRVAEIHTVVPQGLDVSGAGRISVVGDGFGPPGTQVSVLIGAHPVSTVELLSHSELLASYFPGTGTGIPVRVVVAGQPSANYICVNYSAPVVEGISLRLEDDESTGALVRVLVVQGNHLGVTTGVGGVRVTGGGYAQCGGSDATSASVVRGSHVRVGETECRLLSVTPTRLDCVVEVSTGDVVVSVDGRATEPVLFDESELLIPPQVTDVVPRELSPAGGTVIRVSGANFRSLTRVWLSAASAPGVRNASSPDGEVLDDTAASCVPLGTPESGMLECVAPAGHGAPQLIAITGDIVSQPYVGVVYAQPTIDGITPAVLPTENVTVALLGQNFGVQRDGLNVVVDSASSSDATSSPVTECAVLSVNDTMVRCHLAAVSLRRVRLVVYVSPWDPSNAPIASNPFTVDVAGPHISAVEPSVGPTQGGYELVVFGTNFGTGGSTAAAVTIGEQSCVVLSWSSRKVTCAVPAGAGMNLPVLVFTGAQQSPETASAVFAYEAPQINSVYPLRGNTSGFLLTVRGSNFGSAQHTVASITSTYMVDVLTALSGSSSVGAATEPCEIVTIDAHELQCLVPPGLGVNNSLTVSVAGVTVSAAVVSYEAPVLSGITVEVSTSNTIVDAAVPAPVILKGQYFGTSAPIDAVGLQHTVISVVARSASVLAPCESLAWVSDSELRCRFGPQTVGSRSVTATVVGQASNALQLRFECAIGMFGSEGDICETCPDGAYCAGGLVDPLPVDGYYRVSRTQFVRCNPPTACAGVEVSAIEAGGAALDSQVAAVQASVDAAGDAAAASTCHSGYRGDLCAACAAGYYRFDGGCTTCPDLALFFFVLFFLTLVLVGSLGAWLKSRKKIALTSLTIAIDYSQVISIFSGFNFRWPGTVKTELEAASASQLNVEIVAPECSIEFSLTQKWLTMQLIPLGFAALLCVVYGAHKVRKLLAGGRGARGSESSRRTPPQIVQHLAVDGGKAHVVDLVVGGIGQVFYLAYFALVRGALSVFDCITTASGAVVLEVDVSVHCWEPGSEQTRLFPLAVASMVVYGAGIPLWYLFLLKKHQKKIAVDQALRVKGEGLSRATNPAFTTRIRHSGMYKDFQAKFWYWRLLLVLRKLALAVVMVLFNESSLLQAALAVGVLFIAAQSHVYAMPYQVSRMFADVSLRISKVGDAALIPRARVETTRNFNTLEGISLSAAVILLVAGMAFESEVMREGSAIHTLATWLTCVIVVVPVALCGVALFLDLRQAKVYARMHSVARRNELQSHLCRILDADASPATRAAAVQPLAAAGAAGDPKARPRNGGYIHGLFKADTGGRGSGGGYVLNDDLATRILELGAMSAKARASRMRATAGAHESFEASLA